MFTQPSLHQSVNQPLCLSVSLGKYGFCDELKSTGGSFMKHHMQVEGNKYIMRVTLFCYDKK